MFVWNIDRFHAVKFRTNLVKRIQSSGVEGVGVSSGFHFYMKNLINLIKYVWYYQNRPTGSAVTEKVALFVQVDTGGVVVAGLVVTFADTVFTVCATPPQGTAAMVSVHPVFTQAVLTMARGWGALVYVCLTRLSCKSFNGAWWGAWYGESGLSRDRDLKTTLLVFSPASLTLTLTLGLESISKSPYIIQINSLTVELKPKLDASEWRFYTLEIKLFGIEILESGLYACK